MAAMAETAGPSSRVRILAEGFKAAGFEIATCMAEDVNYRKIEGVRNFFLDVPMPLGLPRPIATKMFPVAQKLGVTSKKTVNSFDRVLHFTGNLDYKYLRKSVESVRRAICELKPDIVYSEFSVSGMIAAKREGVPLFTTVSYPTQHSYAHDASLAGGLNKLLAELEFPQVVSALQLFDFAEKKFCPSIYELEPIDDPSVFFCGSLKKAPASQASCEKASRKILAYMGNGTVPAKATLKVLEKAFGGSGYDVYLASTYLTPGDYGGVHAAPRWDFGKLLPEAALFINHGGQNSVMDGLVHGVPQIMVPGKVFERKYNAKSVEACGAGKVLTLSEFEPEHLREIAEKAIGSPEMTERATSLGKRLLNAGGVDVIINEIKNR